MSLLESAVTALVIAFVTKTISAFINHEKELADQAAQATDNLRNQQQAIDTYSSRIQGLYDKINSGQLTLDENVEANRELREIQKELVDNFGEEAFGIDLVTSSLKEQQAVLESVNNLKNSNYLQTQFENTINDDTELEKIWKGLGTAYKVIGSPWNWGEKGSVERAYLEFSQEYDEVWGTHVERMTKKYEGFTATILKTSDQSLNEIIKSYDNIVELSNGDFQIFGNVERVKQTIEELQTDYKDFPGYTDSWSNSLQKVWNKANDIYDKYGDTYNQIIQNNIATNDQYLAYQEELQDIYDRYEKANINNDKSGMVAAAEEYKNAIDRIRQEVSSKTYQDVIINVVPEITSIDYALARVKDRFSKINTNDISFLNLSDPLDQFVDAINSGKYSYADILTLSDEEINQIYDSIVEVYGNISTEDLLTSVMEEFPEISAKIGKQSAEYFYDSFAERFNSSQTDSSTPIFSSESVKEFFNNLTPEEQIDVSKWTDEQWDSFIQSYKDKASDLNGILDEDRQVYKQYMDSLDQLSNDLYELVHEAIEKNVDFSRTVFGNIDTDNRQILEWNEENLERFKNELQEMYEQYDDWEGLKDKLRGSVSTVLGTTAEYDGVEIAFSPILQTEDGPVLLSPHTVNEYIWSLIDKAGENWTADILLDLDAEGIYYNGQLIKGLLADIGDTAIKTSEDMHYVGSTGALQQARDAIHNLALTFPPLQSRIAKTGETEDAWLLRVRQELAQHKKEVEALDKSFKKVNNTLREETEKIPETISESIRDVNTQLDPFFNTLGDLYTLIIPEDGEFNFDNIDISALAALESQFNDIAEDLQEQLGDSFDAEIVEKFFSDIKNASNTDEAQQAVDDFATAWFYNTEVMKDLNPETAKYIERMMELTGITNANEIVTQALNDALAQQALGENYATEMTADHIQAILDENSASQALRIATLQAYAAENIFANADLNTSQKVSALTELAVQFLNVADSAKVAAYAAEQMRRVEEDGLKEDVALRNIEYYTANYKPTQLDVQWQNYDRDNSGGGSGGGSSSEEDPVVTQFEESMKNLDWLREQDLISEKEYLDQLQLLIQNTYGNSEKYADKYYENIRDWLNKTKDYYDNAIGAVTKILDHQIDQYDKMEEKEKEVYEELKKGVDKQTKALNKQVQAIDDVITKIEKQKTSIERNKIEPLQLEIDEIQRNYIDPIDEEIKKLERGPIRELQDKINGVWGTDGLDDFIEKAQREIENIQDTLIQPIQDEIDLRNENIESIQDEIDKMNEANQQRQTALNLQKSAYELEKMQNQRTSLVYTDDDGKGGQLRYRSDPSAVKSAQDAYNDAVFQSEVQARQDIINSINIEIDGLNDIIDGHQKVIDGINEQIKGWEKEKQAIQDQIDELNDYVEYLERSKEPYQDQIDVLQKQIDSYNLETEALDRQIEQHTIKKEMLEEELQTLERQNDTYDENITAIEEKYEALRKPLEEYKKLWEELGTDAEIAEAMADISNFGIEVKDVLSASEPVFTHFKDQYTGVLNDINAGNQDMLTALQAVLGDTGEGMKSYIKTMQPYLQDLKTLDLTSQNTALATAQQLAGQLGHNLTIADTAMQSSKTDAEILGATLTGENGIITSAISALGGEDSGLIGLQTQSDALVNTTTEDVTMLGEASQAMIGETATTINETGIPAMENFDRSIEQNKTSMANLKTEVNRLGEMINNLPDSKDITITIREVHEKVSLSTGSAEFSGTVGSAFANGYQGLKADTPNALRSEYGQPELTVYPNGTYELTTTPTFSDLPKDTVIFNEEQTKRILKNSSKSGKAFADGTNYIPLRDAMPDKAAIFERFEAQLQDNVAKINANVLNMTRNMNDMTKTLTSNSSNIGNTVVLNGGINITCPGVTETEVARNLGGALNREMEKLFQGMALRADQRSLRK